MEVGLSWIFVQRIVMQHNESSTTSEENDLNTEVET
jgi:hypothetical protein